MPTFEVEVSFVIERTYHVEAENADEAQGEIEMSWELYRPETEDIIDYNVTDVFEVE